MKEKKLSLHLIRLLLKVVLVIGVLIIVLPLVWLVISSFKNDAEITATPLMLPAVWKISNYSKAFTVVGKYFFNSVIVVACTLVISITLSCMAAYGISRLKWKLSGVFLTIFLLGMMVPVHAILIPLMVLFSKMNLTDTRVGLIIPYAVFSFAQAIFIMYGFFAALPRELEEAAVIDGCSIWKVYWKIMFPIASPGVATISLFIFNGTWNELLMAMIFINSDGKKTLPVGLTTFIGEHATNMGPMIAAIVIAILPILVIYCIFANQIVGGLTAGAVKG